MRSIYTPPPSAPCTTDTEHAAPWLEIDRLREEIVVIRDRVEVPEVLDRGAAPAR